MTARDPASRGPEAPGTGRAPVRRSRPRSGALSFATCSALAALLAAGSALPVRAAQDDLRLEVARQWAEKGEYEKAVQELRLFLNEHPEAAEVYARIGSLRLRQGKLQQASENFKVALQKDPGLAEAKEGMAKLKQLETRPAPDAAPGASRSAPGGETPVRRESAPVPGGAAPEAPEAAGFSPLEAESAAPRGIYALEEFQQALRQYREKRPDQALASLKQVLAKSPGHPGAYYLGGVIRYEKGDMEKAVYNFKRSFEYPERGFNAHFYLGRIYQRQGRVPEAVDHFQKYLAATRSEAGRRQAERILAQLKDKSGKAPAAPEAAKAEPDAARAKPEGAGAIPEAAAPAHAAAKDTAVHGTAPGSAPGSSASAHGAPAADDSHGAGGKAQPAAPTQQSPSPLVLGLDGAPPFVIADSAGASGKMLREAFEAFKREKYEKSADLLKEVVRRYGGSPNAEAADLDLASVYIRLGLWDNARDRILAYLSGARQPQRFRDLAFYLEGLMHLGRKDGEKAERALLKVKPGGFGGPSREEVDWRLAQAGELTKDIKKWSAYLEKAHASARAPLRKARLSQQLGRLHGRHGRPERALEHYRKSMEPCGKATETAGASGGEGEGARDLADLCRESRLRIADLEFRRKNWQAALEGYRKFAADFPDHAESAWANYQIGNVYQATRNLESALNQYKKVIDNYPDSYWASQAQWKREDAIWRKEYEEVLD